MMHAAAVRFIAAHETCFERTLRVGHVTASAWIVDPRTQAMLLTHHRKLGKWLQCGGHVDDGDVDLRAAALREAREESGLTRLCAARSGIYDIDVHEIPARGEEPAHRHYDIRFAFFGDQSEEPHTSAESHDVRWFSPDAIASLEVDDSVRRLIAKTGSSLSAPYASIGGQAQARLRSP
jgi:8-oxo-dGTP pyrophosphatase MutT (NUDIX family)